MTGSFVTPAEGMITTRCADGLTSLAQLAPLCQLLSAMPCHIAMPKTGTHWENSEVSPVTRFVAVAVIESPSATSEGEKVTSMATLPAASVTKSDELIKLAPSPEPDASQSPLKNSTRKGVLAVELSVPVMCVAPPETVAKVRAGKFWRLFP